MNDKTVPPSVGEFAIGERDQLLARVAELEAAQRNAELLGIGFLVDGVCVHPQRVIMQYPSAAEAALKQPSAGVDERAAFLAGVKAASDKVKAIVEDYDYRHGVTDPDTGTREYPGNGDEWVGQMLELIEDFTGIVCPKEWQARAQLAAPAGVPAANQLIMGMADALRHVIKELDAEACEDIDYAQVSSALAAYEFFKDKPASDVVPVPRELDLFRLIREKRISVEPEYEGQWHAKMYGEEAEPISSAEGDTPEAAIRALLNGGWSWVGLSVSTFLCS